MFKHLAEIGFSVLPRGCLSGRSADASNLEKAVDYHVTGSNDTVATIDQHLTSRDARTKLRHL